VKDIIDTWEELEVYYEEKDAELTKLYNNILTNMHKYNINLVDNNEYLDWCMTYVSPEARCFDGKRCWAREDEEIVLSDDVKEYFFTSEGATLISDKDSLKAALNAMFWFRNDYGFEVSMAIACRRNLGVAEASMMPPPPDADEPAGDVRPPWDLSTCTKETQAAAWDIE